MGNYMGWVGKAFPNREEEGKQFCGRLISLQGPAAAGGLGEVLDREKRP